MTQSGTLIGTPRYMSPEQAEAAKRPVDQRSDIYSLGATLYELLTCRAVFEGKTPQEVLSQILAREPVAPRRLNSAIPADLETVVMKAMAKRPEDRYQSAQELAGDLQRWLKLEPIHARRIGPLGRTFRWCRRNPRLAAVSAAAAIIVLILSGIYYASLLKENANTRAALKSAQEARSLAELNSYTANLSAAEVLLRSSDATSAERHLLLCPVNLRGWEWRHLWFKRDSSVTTLQAKGRFSESPYISTFAFSPDGSRIYWNTSYEVHVWNSITFAPLASYGGIGTILGLSSDGAKVVARRKEANGLAKVGVTEVSTGKVVADLEEKSPASLWRAVFSSDGSRIASQHKGGVVRIWDAATGRLLMAIDSNCSFAEALSYNGAQLAGCAGERSLALWDLASGTKLLMLEMPDPVVTAAFSPDGKWLAAGLNDGTVYILNSATRRIAATVAGQGRPVLAINFSPDGSRVVSCGWDRSVRVSETTSGRLIASLPIPDAQQLTSTGLMLTSVAFAPDGRRLFAGSEIMGEDRGEVRVWRAPTYGGTLFRRFTRYYGPGTIAVSPDSARLAVAIGKSIEVWDSSTGEVLSTWQAADVDSNIECLAFSPDGMRVVSGSDGGTVRIWEGVHGKFNAFTGKEYTGYYVRCAAESRPLALDVLVDMIRNSKFDAAEIEREKGVIVEEMNMYFDSPRDYVDSIYESLVFGDQPLGWDVIGTKETVKAVTRDTFLDYLGRWYVPSRMVIGLGGRLDGDVTAEVERLLGDMASAGSGAPVEADVPSPTKPKVSVQHKTSDQAHLILGTLSRPTQHPDRYVLQVLATILGGGMSSRLFTEVRERRGLAYYIFCHNNTYAETGTLCAQAGVDLSRIDEAIETIVAELRRIVSEPVPASELAKAKEYLKGRLVLQLESPQGLISFGLRREVVEGGAVDPAEVLAGVEAVNREDLERVAHEIIGERALHLALIGPFEDGERFERLLA